MEHEANLTKSKESTDLEGINEAVPFHPTEDLLTFARDTYKETENTALYWDEKGKENYKFIFEGDLLHKHIDLLYLNTFMNVIKDCGPRSILEAGAGYGRVLRFLRDNLSAIETFAGSDISSSQIWSAVKLEPSLLDSNSINYIVADTRKLPYSDDEFDLVYTYGSLMHIPPSSIEDAVKELLRVTSKHLIICEANSEEYSKNSKNAYTHPYLKLAQKCGAIFERQFSDNIGRDSLNYRIYIFSKTNED